MEKRYHVEWTMDIWASSPREAAEQARRYQQMPTTANVFVVSTVDEETNQPFEQHTVDLEETD